MGGIDPCSVCLLSGHLARDSPGHPMVKAFQELSFHTSISRLGDAECDLRIGGLEPSELFQLVGGAQCSSSWAFIIVGISLCFVATSWDSRMLDPLERSLFSGGFGLGVMTLESAVRKNWMDCCISVGLVGVVMV